MESKKSFLVFELMIDSTVPGQPSNEVTKEYLRTGVLPVAREGKLFSVYRSGTKLPPVKDPYQVVTGAVAGDIGSGP